MFYYTINTIHRPSTSTIPYSVSGSAATTLLNAIPPSSSLLGTRSLETPTNLMIVTIQKWSNKAAYDAFQAANAAAITAFVNGRTTYNGSHGITHSQTFLETAIALF